MPLKRPCMPLKNTIPGKHQFRGSMQVEHQLGGKLGECCREAARGRLLLRGRPGRSGALSSTHTSNRLKMFISTTKHDRAP
eukprot:1156747-Pelagomonas_calceolata.AAC.4